MATFGLTNEQVESDIRAVEAIMNSKEPWSGGRLVPLELQAGMDEFMEAYGYVRNIETT